MRSVFSPRLRQRLELAAAALLTVALAAVLGTQAWLYHQRTLQTMTAINAPVSLAISSGDPNASESIELGDIDVSENGSQDYVFCVHGPSLENYVLQLAHTTNIPFTYTISYAELLDAEPADLTGVVAYTANDDTQTTYYYRKAESSAAVTASAATTEVPGRWLNLAASDATTRLANDSYHALTYGVYSNVQKNAEPLYWQSSAITPRTTPRTTSDEKFCDYYILTISWSELQNDRETDIVYLMAGYSAQNS
jgi:hypothetical protein